MKMATGSNIRTLRNLAGLTLEQLSELSGVEVGTISALENRDSSRSKYFPAIAQAFGITTDDLSSEITSEQLARAVQNRYQMRGDDVPNWPTVGETVAAVFDRVDSANPSNKAASRVSPCDVAREVDSKVDDGSIATGHASSTACANGIVQWYAVAM